MGVAGWARRCSLFFGLPARLFRDVLLRLVPVAMSMRV
jgi:hypothetical protein